MLLTHTLTHLYLFSGQHPHTHAHTDCKAHTWQLWCSQSSAGRKAERSVFQDLPAIVSVCCLFAVPVARCFSQWSRSVATCWVRTPASVAWSVRSRWSSVSALMWMWRASLGQWALAATPWPVCATTGGKSWPWQPSTAPRSGPQVCSLCHVQHFYTTFASVTSEVKYLCDTCVFSLWSQLTLSCLIVIAHKPFSKKMQVQHSVSGSH